MLGGIGAEKRTQTGMPVKLVQRKRNRVHPRWQAKLQLVKKPPEKPAKNPTQRLSPEKNEGRLRADGVHLPEVNEVDAEVVVGGAVVADEVAVRVDEAAVRVVVAREVRGEDGAPARIVMRRRKGKTIIMQKKKRVGM